MDKKALRVPSPPVAYEWYSLAAPLPTDDFGGLRVVYV